MKLYTKKGDDGWTDLFRGGRVRKSNRRVEAFGTVDELNCALGVALAGCTDEQLVTKLREIQSHLFSLGAHLATSPSPNTRSKTMMPPIDDQDTSDLERHIDQISDELPPLRTFILPGGSELAARLHLTRAVCRRAERACVSLAEVELVSPQVIIFLNRLSDVLFAMSRWANQLENVKDVPWLSGREEGREQRTDEDEG